MFWKSHKIFYHIFTASRTISLLIIIILFFRSRFVLSTWRKFLDRFSLGIHKIWILTKQTFRHSLRLFEKLRYFCRSDLNNNYGNVSIRKYVPLLDAWNQCMMDGKNSLKKTTVNEGIINFGWFEWISKVCLRVCKSSETHSSLLMFWKVFVLDRTPSLTYHFSAHLRNLLPRECSPMVIDWFN